MTKDRFIGESQDRNERIALILKQRAIGIIWSIDDVKKLRPDLDDRQCAIVLYDVAQTHNPAVGINLSFIQSVANSLYPRSQKE